MGLGLALPSRKFSPLTQVKNGSTFTLRRSTLDVCLGGQRESSLPRGGVELATVNRGPGSGSNILPVRKQVTSVPKRELTSSGILEAKQLRPNASRGSLKVRTGPWFQAV